MARRKPTYRPKIGFSRFSNTLGFCVLGLIQSSTVLYLGSYKVVGEVVEFNWWRTENQRFRKKKPKTGYRQRIDICTSSIRFQPVTFYLQAAQAKFRLLEFVNFKINQLNLACPHTKCMEPTGVTRSKKYRFPVSSSVEIQDPRSLGCPLHAVSISTRHTTAQKSFPYKVAVIVEVPHIN